MIGISSSVSEFVTTRGDEREVEVGRVARAFESMIVSELLRFGSQSMADEHPLDGGSAGRMARDQLFAQLAAYATQGDGLGLAASLEAEMEASPDDSGDASDAGLGKRA